VNWLNNIRSLIKFPVFEQEKQYSYFCIEVEEKKKISTLRGMGTQLTHQTKLEMIQTTPSRPVIRWHYSSSAQRIIEQTNDIPNKTSCQHGLHLLSQNIYCFLSFHTLLLNLEHSSSWKKSRRKETRKTNKDLLLQLGRISRSFLSYICSWVKFCSPSMSKACFWNYVRVSSRMCMCS
jgi:hypothetical protein